MEGGWGKFVRLLQERGQTLENYRSINKEQFNALLDSLGITDPSERAVIAIQFQKHTGAQVSDNVMQQRGNLLSEIQDHYTMQSIKKMSLS